MISTLCGDPVLKCQTEGLCHAEMRKFASTCSWHGGKRVEANCQTNCNLPVLLSGVETPLKPVCIPPWMDCGFGALLCENCVRGSCAMLKHENFALMCSYRVGLPHCCM